MATTPIADQGVTWLCKCGERPLKHHEYCDRCGEARPAPPPEAEGELSDIGRPDAALHRKIWMRLHLDAAEALMQRHLRIRLPVDFTVRPGSAPKCADEPDAVDHEQEWR